MAERERVPSVDDDMPSRPTILPPRGTVFSGGGSSYIPVSKTDIKRARVVFKWLPTPRIFSCDLVHGSWHFVLGSLISCFIPVGPIIDIYHPFFGIPDGSALPIFANVATYYILIICGIFFTFGSYLFVRCFEQPRVAPLCKCLFPNDEIFAAWMFFFGSFPAIPFVGIFLGYDFTSYDNWGMMVMAILFVGVSGLFVHASYHDHTASKPILFPILVKIFGERNWIQNHYYNDWLASLWFSYYVSLLCTLGSVGMMCLKFNSGNQRQIYIYGTGALDTFFFLIGSAYYLAGSYKPVYATKFKSPKHSIKLQGRRNSETHLIKGDGDSKGDSGEKTVSFDNDDLFNVEDLVTKV